MGVNFDIETDQLSTDQSSTLFYNSRLIRWSLLLQKYSFTVRYIRGVDNVTADFLSRNPDGKLNNDKIKKQ